MADQHIPDVAAVVTAAATLRADLIRTAQNVVQLMGEVATAREHAAASYRQMARGLGPDSARYLQHAAQLHQDADRARRIAEEELEQLAKWQPPGGTDKAAD